jgi:branched-chain amino acid transport system permease protein
MSLQSLVQVAILGLLMGGVFALLSSGLTLIFGVMRVINLAHGSFIIASSYTALWLFTSFAVDPVLSILFSTPIFFFAGMAIQRFLLSRLEGQPPGTTVLLTFGLALIFEGVYAFRWKATMRFVDVSYAGASLNLSGFLFPVSRVLATVLSLAVLIFLFFVLRRSKLGMAIRATMQSRETAQMIGINVANISAASMGIGVATAAIGGAILSFIFAFQPATQWLWISSLLSIVVLGGLGSLRGAFVGSLILGFANAMAAVLWSTLWAPMVFYVTLFAVLLVKPQGLFGVVTRAEEL